MTFAPARPLLVLSFAAALFSLWGCGLTSSTPASASQVKSQLPKLRSHMDCEDCEDGPACDPEEEDCEGPPDEPPPSDPPPQDSPPQSAPGLSCAELTSKPFMHDCSCSEYDNVLDIYCPPSGDTGPYSRCMFGDVFQGCVCNTVEDCQIMRDSYCPKTWTIICKPDDTSCICYP